MAVIQDPQGAVFSLWQPVKHIGAELVNVPGAFCWNELYTHDIDASGAFYTKLFGWSAKTAEMGNGMSYTSFMNGDWPAGGMMEIQKEWGEVPPNWSIYFAVDDCDATCEKIKKLGGKVDNPPMDIPEVGRFAVCADPQGAYFAVIKMTNPQD
jgi:predicted enzyme related to lactoylglutathione lyase